MRLDLTSILLKNWMAIIGSACAGALIFFTLGSTVLLKYKSEGLLSVELSVTEYKRISESLGATSDILIRLKEQPGLGDDAEALMRVLRNGNAKWHAPVARVSKAEAKDLPDAVLKLEFSSSELQRPYSGVRLTALAPDAQQSARLVNWLGEYLRDTAAKEILRQEIFGWKADNETFVSRAQEQRIKISFDAEQSQSRAIALKKVLLQYPDLAKVDGRSVVDVRQDNEKFMSPGGQLIAAEVEMINHQASLARIERQIIQANFMIPFLAASEKALRESNSGQELVKRLSDLVVLTSKHIDNDIQREPLLGKAAQIAEIAARFFSRTQFIVPPSTPQQAETPRPMMLAALGSLFFGFLALLWALRDWIIAALRESDDVSIKD